MTEAQGIHQSDVIIRTALMMAIADLRANPWLLDHVFASLLEDEVTASTYGEKERAKAKSWFLRTALPVVMDYHQEQPEGPCISIALVDSTEAETTLGDIHYVPNEEVDAEWPPLAGPFDVQSYDPITGTVIIPQTVAAVLVVAPGMILIDRAGRELPILTTKNSLTFTIPAGTVADLTGAMIKGSRPRLIKTLESQAFKETYRLGCHALGEASMLTWLHSIVVFCLLRYKQVLLEGRGFERSTLSSAPFARDERWGNIQNLWTRFVTVSGFVRQSWPKDLAERIRTTSGAPVFERVNTIPETTTTEPGFEAGTEPWSVGDGIGVPFVDIDEE